MDSKNSIHHLAQYDILENDTKAQAIKEYLFDEIAKSKEESLKKESIINKLQSEKVELSKQLEHIEKQLQFTSDKAAEQKRNNENQIIAALNDNYQFENEIKNLKNQVATKEKDLIVLNDSLKTYRHSLDIEKQRCENLQSNMTKLSQNIAEQKNNIDQNQFEIKSLNVKINDFQNSINEKNIYIVEQNHKIKSLENEKNELSKKMDELTAENKNLTHQHQQTEDLKSQISLRIKAVELEKNNALVEINEFKRQILMLKSEIETKEKQMLDLKYKSEQEIVELTRKYESQINQDRKEFSQEIEMTVKKYEATINQIQSEATEQISKSKKNHAADLEAVQYGQQKFITQLKDKHLAEVKKIIHEKDSSLFELTQKFENEINTLTTDKEKTIQVVTEEKNSTLKNMRDHFENEIAELKSKYQNEINIEKRINSEKVDLIQIEKDNKIKMLTDMLETQSHSIHNQYSSKIQQLTQNYEQMSLQQKNQFESSYSKIVQQYENQITQIKAEFEISYAQMKNDLEQKYATENTRLELANKQIAQDFKMEKEFLEKEVAQTRSENFALKNNVEKLDVKTKILQKEISKQVKSNLDSARHYSLSETTLQNQIKSITEELSSKNIVLQQLVESEKNYALEKKSIRKKIKDSVRKLNKKAKAKQAQFANLEKELSILRRDFYKEVDKYKNDYLEKEVQLIQNHDRKYNDLHKAYELVKNNLNTESERFQKVIQELTEKNSYEMSGLKSHHESEFKRLLEEKDIRYNDSVSKFEKQIASIELENSQALEKIKAEITSLQAQKIEKLESEILKYKKQTTALSNMLINYQNERAKVSQQVELLNHEVKTATALNPIHDLLKVTQYELDKKELELKKMPASSPVRPKIELQLEELFKQRAFLSNLIEEAQSEFSKTEDKATQIKLKTKSIF